MIYDVMNSINNLFYGILIVYGVSLICLGVDSILHMINEQRKASDVHIYLFIISTIAIFFMSFILMIEFVVLLLNCMCFKAFIAIMKIMGIDILLMIYFILTTIFYDWVYELHNKGNLNE